LYLFYEIEPLFRYKPGIPWARFTFANQAAQEAPVSFVPARCDACHEDMPDVEQRYEPLLCRTCHEHWELRTKFQREHDKNSAEARKSAGLTA
jgi:hypothetical protein